MASARGRLLAATVSSVLVAGALVAAAATASAASAPTVTALSAHDGRTAGGVTLTVTGTNFATGAAVLFGTASGTSVRIVSSTQLTVVVPAAAAGTVDVRVRQGTATSATGTADRYTFHAPPAVTALSPASGADTGSTAVTVTGSGFESITGVTIGGATVVAKVVSTTSLTLTTPAHGAGSGAVVVTGTYGSSTAATASTFTWLDRTAPGPVTALTVDQSATGLSLHWTRPADSDFAGVTVTRTTGVPGGSIFASAAATTLATTTAGVSAYADTALTPDTTYTYTVTARDTAGNTSAPVTITSTTLLGPDANVAGDAMPPIVYVHGYFSNSSPCNRSVTDLMAGPILTEYYAGVPAADLHTVAFYACDAGGDPLFGYGPAAATTYPTTTNDANTDLRRYAYELAWYLYDNFSARGRAADVVAASMGGVLITYAMQRVAAGDPLFPPALLVTNVVTFSTPFAGANVGCPSDTECTQLAAGSTLTSAITAAGAPMTDRTRWTVVGSSAGCDLVPASSSLALTSVTYAVDYTSPCYDHGGYESDYSGAQDAVGTVNGQPTTTGWHSLALMQAVLAGA
ncbi:MAG: IPT/TIG domain-containing protein [Jatrophihabitans sp.]|uniref:IPT/TIG domain-containing protein n=1 Tax=Jatrophihabitans sp. TaxID=1932789 RepID=UPI003F7E4FDE